MPSSDIILLTGTSSAGKTSIARELQRRLPKPFFHMSLDAFIDMMPRPDNALFDSMIGGFHRSIAAMAGAGNCLIVDHVLLLPEWHRECLGLLCGHSVLTVGVTCSLEELERREKGRADRMPGLARSQYHQVHAGRSYDLEVASGQLTPEECADRILELYHSRSPGNGSLVIPDEFTDDDEVEQGLTSLEEQFYRLRDRRSVFMTAYLIITRDVRAAADRQEFRDPDWIRRNMIGFANLYREALVHYETGRREEVPEAWRTSFDWSVAGKGLFLEDLILGVNAHVNRDLPFALHRAGIDPDRASRYEDHSAVNGIIEQAVHTVQDRIARKYAAGLGRLDSLLGFIDEYLMLFSLERARDNAWVSGCALVDARTEADRRRVAGTIESHAQLVAEAVLGPRSRVPWLYDLLRLAEQPDDWWDGDLRAGALKPMTAKGA